MAVFNSSETPQYPDEFESLETKLVAGMRFKVVNAVTVTAIRYFKAQAENGLHRGLLYRANGTLLARTADFYDDACSTGGWVQVALTQPMTLVVGREYIVAMEALTYYALSEDYPFADKAGSILPLGGFYSFMPGQVPTTGRGVDNYWVDGKSDRTTRMSIAARVH